VNKRILSSIFLAATLVATGCTANNSSMSKKQIEQVVHDYLINHPEVLVEASKALQTKQQNEMEKLQKQAVTTIRENAKTVFFNSQDPVAGNPKGTITLVEFFDYQCSHCRDMAPTLAKALADNKQLRVIFKEFPIFGAESELAAKAALAAAKQDKFLSMHEALMKATDFSQANILRIADEIGLDPAKFKADWDSATVNKVLEDNKALAKQLKIYFTPVLIAAKTQATDKKIIFVPGQVTDKMLDQITADLMQG
jgi:protein-disulfide isomerase